MSFNDKIKLNVFNETKYTCYIIIHGRTKSSQDRILHRTIFSNIFLKVTLQYYNHTNPLLSSPCLPAQNQSPSFTARMGTPTCRHNEISGGHLLGDLNLDLNTYEVVFQLLPILLRKYP